MRRRFLPGRRRKRPGKCYCLGVSFPSRAGCLTRDDAVGQPDGSVFARDSRAAQPKMPLAMVDASASTRSSITSARGTVDLGVVGCGEGRELREVTGQSQVAIRRERDRARCEPVCAAGEVRDLARERRGSAQA